MPREEGWYFLQAGKFLERAEKTARALDVKYHLLVADTAPHAPVAGPGFDAAVAKAVLQTHRGKIGLVGVRIPLLIDDEAQFVRALGVSLRALGYARTDFERDLGERQRLRGDRVEAGAEIGQREEAWRIGVVHHDAAAEAIDLVGPDGSRTS